ncbi:MAG: tRNA preQ1(34) S-adenosylmethionine ribosyltransferase-isomerase QueA [Elusimicrobia bacterium RIFOXYD2_FULL_34_15]|nr:MAG: tRNA preQ1(34) S-adenosylmethionine ribosyltransferase-isomerase QueA [Elusimicrobia bacterium RIFOXYD2_FULL_34_15]
MNYQKLSDFNYKLPKELIAQYPSDKRDESKLLVLHRNTGKIEHKIFKDIINYFSEGDVLVLNKTKVIPARLQGKKKTGGKIELLLLNLEQNNTAKAIAKPLKNLKLNDKIFFKDDFCEIIDIVDGVLKIKFHEDLQVIINKYGKVPLPPYIKREATDIDTERYQTIFADKPGSVAAPTAGLHFTEDILNNFKNKKVGIAEAILHVSWGTFAPVRCDNIAEHKMTSEYFEIEDSTARKINLAKRKIAVGTTSVRVLETSSVNNTITSQKGFTDIFIYPGYKFKNTDMLITNFHLPETTLIMLVCAFAGRDLIFKAYEEAKSKNYRFASYGDAMLIL